MATVLDKQLYGGANQPPISSEPVDQAEHAAAPTEYTFTTSASSILITIAAFYVIIYLLHGVERVIAR